MKQTFFIMALLTFTFTACSKDPANEPFVPSSKTTASSAMPSGHPKINNQGIPRPNAPNVEMTQHATVVSTLEVPQFTYIEVNQNGSNHWLAASEIEVKKGDVIQFDIGTEMTNFESQSLNRTFPRITFVNRTKIVAKK